MKLNIKMLWDLGIIEHGEKVIDASLAFQVNSFKKWCDDFYIKNKISREDYDNYLTLIPSIINGDVTYEYKSGVPHILYEGKMYNLGENVC